MANAAHTRAFPKIAIAAIRNKNIIEVQSEALRAGLEHCELATVEFSVVFEKLIAALCNPLDI